MDVLKRQDGRHGCPARLQQVNRRVVQFLYVEPWGGVRTEPDTLFAILAR